MRNLYKLHEFKQINSIVGERIATRIVDGTIECGLCLNDTVGKEFFLLYGGSVEKLSTIVSERASDIMVLKRGGSWIITLRPHIISPQVRQTSRQKGIGIINWYAPELGKGYGVITCLHEKANDDFDVFLHHTVWSDALPVSSENLFLVFDYIQERERKKATTCRFLAMNDNWEDLSKILTRSYVEIPDGRRGKKRVYLLDSLLSTLKLHNTPEKKDIFLNKIEQYGITLSEDQKKTCLIKGLLPVSYFKGDLDNIIDMLSTNELIDAIRNSDNEDEFVRVVEKEINDINNVWGKCNGRKSGYYGNEKTIASELYKIILSFNSIEIQNYLCGALLAKFPEDIHPETFDKFADTAHDIWEKRNKYLPMSLLNKYSLIRTAIWYSGAKIPLDRAYICDLIEKEPWFINAIIHHSSKINIYPVLSIAKKRLHELSFFANDDDFQIITKWYHLLRALRKNKIIIDSANPVAQVLLWIDGDTHALDFEFASKCFIYLKGSEQVRFVKRLIQKRALGDTSITIDTICKLVYADVELYRDNNVINPNRTLDISTHALVQILKRFAATGAFMMESDLFQIVFNRTQFKNNSFKLDYYFDKCHGRCQQAGTPREGSNKTYYWYPREFCDAPRANKLDEQGKEFYWCGNARCYNSSILLHTTDQWESYSLWDIVHILEINPINDVVSFYKEYITFIAQVNKYNQIAEKLKCKECGEILYPKLPEGVSNFHYYTVTQFYCINGNCSQFNKEIYLNHCFHPGCVGIIDSRESKQCENGRYICPSCASCCTDHEFDKAIQYKKINGGYISHSLEECHRDHKGHNDKGFFFCYKCGSKLKEVRHDGESVKEYQERCGYGKISYGKVPCKNGYEMPVILFDGGDFIALGKDIKDKSEEEIRSIISELRVVEGNPYKSIVHFSSLSTESIFYCEKCSNVKYKAKPYEWKSQYDNSEYKHVAYELERIG